MVDCSSSVGNFEMTEVSFAIGGTCEVGLAIVIH